MLPARTVKGSVPLVPAAVVIWMPLEVDVAFTWAHALA
jgi:hypothetical protein